MKILFPYRITVGSLAMSGGIEGSQGYVWCPEPDPELVERAVAKLEAAAAEQAQSAREQQAIWAIEDNEKWEELNSRGIYAWDDPRFRDLKFQSEISEPEIGE